MTKQYFTEEQKEIINAPLLQPYSSKKEVLSGPYLLGIIKEFLLPKKEKKNIEKTVLP